MIQLSDLLRFTLYECRDSEVPIARELKVIGDYIALEMSRIGDGLKVNFEIHGKDHMPNKLIPPMVFLALVENGFKHGVLNESGYNEIDIEMDVAQEYASLSVTNPTSKSSDVNLDTGEGIGLRNVERQLTLIYGDQFKIEQNIVDNMFNMRLKIPYMYGADQRN